MTGFSASRDVYSVSEKLVGDRSVCRIAMTFGAVNRSGKRRNISYLVAQRAFYDAAVPVTDRQAFLFHDFVAGVPQQMITACENTSDRNGILV